MRATLTICEGVPGSKNMKKRLEVQNALMCHCMIEITVDNTEQPTNDGSFNNDVSTLIYSTATVKTVVIATAIATRMRMTRLAPAMVISMQMVLGMLALTRMVTMLMLLEVLKMVQRRQ